MTDYTTDAPDWSNLQILNCVDFVSGSIVQAALITKARGMKKLALVLVCVGLLICVLNQPIETAVGLSGYLIAAVVMTAGIALGVRGLFASKSYAFDQRATEGGFLS